jgi:tight adherence protein B
MRRRAIPTLAAALALAAALSAGAVAATTKAGSIRITQAAGARFPDRAYIVSLPAGRRLGASDVTVLEDGKPVSDVRVTPAGEANSRQFGIVLAIDASESMAAGGAITSALEAARAFATHKAPAQRLAVLLFSKKVVVRLPFTADQARIQAALVKTPKLLYGTRIYDAVDSGIAMLKRAQITAGSVIVLSDGSDLGSATTLYGAAQHARDAHVRVFTVGLKSRFYDRTALRQLAANAGGVSAEAGTPKQLRAIYDALGSQLARDYLVRYRSFAQPNRPVAVSIKVKGAASAATSGYRSPRLALPAVVSQPYHEPVGRRIWTSGWTMLVIALIAAGLVAVVIVSVVRQFPHGAVRGRIAEFVSLPGAGEGRRPSAVLTTRVLAGTERAFGRTQWWAAFKRDLEIAQIRVAPAQIVVLAVLGTVAVMWLLTVLSGTWLLGLLGLGVPFAVRGFVRFKLDRVRRNFGDQLPENLQVLASALRAGHSFVGAMAVVVDDAAEPTQSEFRRVVADEQLGVPVEDGLMTVADRMESRELEQVALVAALQRQAGGNTAEVLDRVTETLRERQELRRTVRTLTAQGRLSRWIVSALPVALLTFISLVNPSYMSVLYKETVGRVLLVFAALLIIAGSLVIRKIINIKV